MTICIAALCNNGQGVVVASDRMITAEFLALEFEHPDAKIEVLANSCVGLSAGDALASTELFGACGTVAQNLQAPTVEQITEEVKGHFVRAR